MLNDCLVEYNLKLFEYNYHNDSNKHYSSKQLSHCI